MEGNKIKKKGRPTGKEKRKPLGKNLSCFWFRTKIIDGAWKEKYEQAYHRWVLHHRNIHFHKQQFQCAYKSEWVTGVAIPKAQGWQNFSHTRFHLGVSLTLDQIVWPFLLRYRKHTEWRPFPRDETDFFFFFCNF